MSINTNNPDVSSFQAKYKYKIAGEYDVTLSKLGGAVTKTLDYGVLKTARIKEVGLLNALKSSSLSDSEKSLATADAKMAFARDGYRLYKKERLDPDTKMTAKQSVRALNYSLKELTDAAAEYIKARNAGLTTPAQDAKFIADTKLIYNDAKSVAVTLKVGLRQAGEYFSLDLTQAKENLKKIAASLAAIGAPVAAPAPDEADTTAQDSPDTVAAEPVHTLDVQA